MADRKPTPLWAIALYAVIGVYFTYVALIAEPRPAAWLMVLYLAVALANLGFAVASIRARMK